MKDNSEQKAAFAEAITIWPHRSLTKKGFIIVMVALASLAFCIGLGFFLLGAWPVIGFLGLEILIVWGAFKLNYRAAKRRQTLQADSHTLQITDFFPNGKRQDQEIPTGWIKVSLTPSQSPDVSARNRQKVIVSSHGKHVAVGDFLHPAETPDLARRVQSMVDRAQSAHHREFDENWPDALDETSLRPH